MERQPARQLRSLGLYRFLSILPLPSLMAALVWLSATPAAARDVSSNCHSAGLAFGQLGSERVEYYQDRQGHDVELWCVRGIFSAHYDVRIGSHDEGQDSADPRGQTIAGCFFNHGSNVGPELFFGADGTYAKVEWTNRSPPPDAVTYHFSYDYGTGMVTITVRTACHAPIVRVVAPQRNFVDLQRLIPDPQDGSCSTQAQAPPTSARGPASHR